MTTIESFYSAPTNNTPVVKIEPKSNDDNTFHVVVAIVALLMIAVCLTAIIICLWKSNKNRNQRNNQNQQSNDHSDARIAEDQNSIQDEFLPLEVIEVMQSMKRVPFRIQVSYFWLNHFIFLIQKQMLLFDNQVLHILKTFIQANQF